MILTYAGRRPAADGELPPHAVARVGAQLERVIAGLAPAAVVGSAAAGVDLLVLEAAVARSIPAVAVVAESRARFREQSVVDVGADWGRRYDRVLEAPRVEVVEEAVGGPTPYLAVNEVILGLAQRRVRAQPASGPVAALAVFGTPRPGGDVTVAFAAEARRRSLPVIVLAPGDGSLRCERAAGLWEAKLGATAQQDVPADAPARLREAIAASRE